MAKTKRETRPDAISRLFHSFVDDFENSYRILQVLRHGAHLHLGMPNLLKALQGYTEATEPNATQQEPDSQSKIASAKFMAEIADAEISKDFPLIHSLFLIYLWSSMEELVKSLIATHIHSNPTLRRIEELRKIKVSIVDYESQKGFDKSLYLIELLDQTTKASMSRGVGRFERLLEPFGLSGSVDAETRKILFEMHELRNVIAHRRALADRKFVTSVPWAKYKIGQPIKVTSGDVHRYHGAIANYVTVIIQRFTELMKERAK